MPARHLSFVGAMLVATLLPWPSLAGGFHLAERGARSFSLSGAHIAGADDLNAMWLNPAGLTRLEGRYHAWVDLALIGARQGFARAFDADVARNDPRFADGFPEVHGSGTPFFDPSFGLATDLGLEDWVFAFGVYGPYASTNAWPADGPQRHALISLQPIALTAQLTAAWRPLPTLSVALGLQAIYTRIHQRLSISSYPGVFGWAEDPDLEALADVTLEDPFTPSANLGVQWAALPWLDVGLSAQLPVTAELKGRIAVNLPSHWYFKDSRVRGDALSGSLDFPAILRLGVRLHDEERLSVEIAATAELWSTLDRIALTPEGIAFEDVPGIGTFEVRPVTLVQDFRDVYSARLGVSWRPEPLPFTLRGGAHWESGAPPDQTLSVLRIDGEKLGLTFGATLPWSPFTFDLAAGWVQMLPREVSSSEVRQVNPLHAADPTPYGEGGPSVVGNGRYTLSHWVVALATHVDW
jgi:long-subunit fatty acid transport protein